MALDPCAMRRFLAVCEERAIAAVAKSLHATLPRHIGSGNACLADEIAAFARERTS